MSDLCYSSEKEEGNAPHFLSPPSCNQRVSEFMRQDRSEEKHTGGYAHTPVLPVGPTGIVARKVMTGQSPCDKPKNKDPA